VIVTRTNAGVDLLATFRAKGVRPDHRSSSGREPRESLMINSLSAACPQESAETR
jgi:hypothetical protein